MAHRLDETLRKGTIMSVKQLAPKAALWAGLNTAAPDEQSWLAGAAAYDASQNEGHTLEESFYQALNAAAPDAPSWLAGRRDIYNVLYGRPVGHVTTRAAASAVARRMTNTVRSAFDQPKPAQHS